MRKGIQQQNWFVENYREASNIFGDGGHLLPIASPIFSVADGYNFRLRNEEDFKRKFPFFQIIRGDGACYFNACMTGILNKCVGNKEKWNLLRQSLIDKGCQSIANEIGRENEVLTRQKVNQLLQVKGDVNIVKRLTRELLIPMHADFIRVLERNIAVKEAEIGSGLLTEEETRGRREVIAMHGRTIKMYDTRELANTYYESDLKPIVKQLFPGVEIESLSRQILDDGYYAEVFQLEDLEDPDKIYLWNPGGGAHFDLLYSQKDLALVEEVGKARASVGEDVIEERVISQEEFEKKISPYLQSSATDDFSQLVQEINTSNSTSESNQQVKQKEMLFLVEMIEAHEEALKAARSNDVSNAKAEFATHNVNEAIIKGEPYDGLENDIRVARTLGQETKQHQNRGFVIYAALCGRSEFIDILYKAGEDFSQKDSVFLDNTALIWAIANANNEFASYLLQFSNQREDVNLAIDHISESSTTALHLAVAKGYTNRDSGCKALTVPNHVLVEQLIINLGADPNIISNSGTALDIAVARRDLEMVRAICASPKINLQTIEDALGVLQYSYDQATGLVNLVAQPVEIIDQTRFRESSRTADDINNILVKAKNSLRLQNIDRKDGNIVEEFGSDSESFLELYDDATFYSQDSTTSEETPLVNSFQDKKGKIHSQLYSNDYYELWNYPDGLEYVRLKSQGLLEISNHYFERDNNIYIRIEKCWLNSKEYSLRELPFPDQNDFLRSVRNLSETMENGEIKGLIYSVENRDEHVMHTIPFAVAKKNNGETEIVDFEGWFQGQRAIKGINIRQVENYFEQEGKRAQLDHHSCTVFAIDTLKNCLSSKEFAQDVMTENGYITLDKMALGQSEEYRERLSESKKNSYIFHDDRSSKHNLKAFYKGHQYAEIINADHKNLLQQNSRRLVDDIDENRRARKESERECPRVDSEIKIEPSTSIKAVMIEPLMTNEKSFYYGGGKRGNKFRAVAAVYTNQKIVENTFIDILSKIADDKGLNKMQVMAIIEKSKEQGSLKRKGNEALEDIIDVSGNVIVTGEQAKKFSAAFQKECKKSGIYTGREEGVKEYHVGLRLTFIPDSVVKDVGKMKIGDFEIRASNGDLNLLQSKVKEQIDSLQR